MRFIGRLAALPLLFASLLVVGCSCGGGRPGRLDAGPLPDVVVTFDAPYTWDAPAPPPDTGPVERVELCEACVLDAQCGLAARCVQLDDGNRACLKICDPDLPECPRGFSCIHNLSTGGSITVCAPVGTVCCVDEDADGFGRGAGCRGPDCNDANIDVHPEADELCNGVDDDCDDRVDDSPIDCGATRCRRTSSGTYEHTPAGTCDDGACAEPGRTSCGLYTCDGGEESGDFCASTCADEEGVDRDHFCIDGAHCDHGTCEPDVPNGEACDEDSDCTSSHCENGFCCADGHCCQAATDCPGSGGVGATCDDTVTCQGSRGELTCIDNRCGTREGVPDDSACGPTLEANDCGLFRSIYCTGAASQSPPSCPTSCGADGECDDGAHCDTICMPDLPDGGACDENSDCISGHCNHGVCCAGGDCCSFPSDCAASYGSPATCDSPATCQGTRNAATCANFQCGTAMGVPDDSACTPSIVANECGLYPARRCTGGTDQLSPMCAETCSSDAECDANAHCDLDHCLPDLPDGEACDEDSDCVGNHCQNGYCCASGDCCAGPSNCPFGIYGEPSECTSPSTCQGRRRDPTCTASFQCALGSYADDDSGCAGLVANTCGLYPSVMCTSAPTQPANPAAMCGSSCASEADCDPGAQCLAGTCQPRGMVGDACVNSGQCESGLSCVDGVCCTSSCTGSCQACNVPGSLGTCTPIPSGQDPDNECGSLSCAAYYAGFTGSTCYRRADAPASVVSCNGAGACQPAATVCPLQPSGAAATSCQVLCQSPTSGTCTGLVAGACTNVTPSPATHSCGVGACQRTVNRCEAGAPLSCTPGTAQPETCNGIDDNCNGAIDDGLSGDTYEPNNSCGAARFLGTIATLAKDGYQTSVTIRPTLYASGDVDVFYVNWAETDNQCMACGGVFSTDEDYRIRATLSVPSGAGSYQICARHDACGGWGTTTCRTVPAGSSGYIDADKDGACSPFSSDSGTAYIEVHPLGSPGFQCEPYTLTVAVETGCYGV